MLAEPLEKSLFLIGQEIPRFLEVKTQHLLPRANDTHLGNGTAFWGSNEAAVINP